MSIWIILWLLLSSSLLLFMGWILFILFKQKAAWSTFSKKYKLRYKRGTTMQAPEMGGVIENYKMEFFASEHATPDLRSVRSLTAVEITLNSILPVDAVIASGGMVAVAQGIGFKAELRPDQEGWDKSWIVATDNKHVLSAYLTPERLDILTRLMKVKNAWIICIFRKETMLLRIDLPDPLMFEDRLEKIKSMMLKTAQIMELKQGESQRLKKEEVQSMAQMVSLDVEDKDLEEVSSLTLEEDDEAEEDREKASETPDKEPPESP